VCVCVCVCVCVHVCVRVCMYGYVCFNVWCPQLDDKDQIASAVFSDVALICTFRNKSCVLLVLYGSRSAHGVFYPLRQHISLLILLHTYCTDPFSKIVDADTTLHFCDPSFVTYQRERAAALLAFEPSTQTV
jgi:hypothetical protein